MKLHRAVTLVVLMFVSVVFLGVMAASALALEGPQSLWALLIVIVAAAVAGVAFSWRRYFPNRGGR